MKLTPTQARNKIRQELDRGNGAYMAARFYDVRVSAGFLQVSYDFESWEDVAPGSEVRNGHGRALFTYEPETDYKALIVVAASIANPESVAGKPWAETFKAGAVIEVVRETATQFIISPLGFEQRVYKSTGMLVGYKGSKSSVKFKVKQKPLAPFISGDWHAWQGALWNGDSPVMLSNEATKDLQEFETVDKCINWLFVNDHKEAARALNAHFKGEA